jgi:hypothetical protein
MSRRQIDTRIMHNPEWRRALFAAARAKYPGVNLNYVNSDGDEHFMQEWGNPRPFIVAEAEVGQRQGSAA